MAMPGTNQMNWGDASVVSRYSAEVIRTRSLGWCWKFQGHARTSQEIADLVLDEFTRLNR
jgi:hypothetical protein